MGSLKDLSLQVFRSMDRAEEVCRLRTKLLAMERELARLEAPHGANGHGNGNGSSARIAYLRASITETQAKIADLL